jgi:hypothetical protein
MKSKNDTQFIIQISILGILILLLLYGILNPGSGGNIGIGSVSASEVIPTGVPAVYGEELDLNYDYVSPNDKQVADQTISFLANIDRTETLEGEDLERYIDILYNQEGGISCEYCCGARSVIFESGQPACGCAHSYAMRGLTKYLIKYHPEMSDEEIFEEIAKWKVLFFPGIMEGKAQVLADNGIEFNYINLASNKYRGIEKGQTSGGMVGGC